MAYCSPFCIVHDKYRHALLNHIFEHAHNMRMVQARQRLGLSKEVFDIAVLERGPQQLERGGALEIDMLAQIDVRKSPLPKHTGNAIVAQLLSDTIHSHQNPGGSFSRTRV